MSGWKSGSLAAMTCAALVSCASDKAADNAAPERPSLQERLTEGGGYKQNENGEWVPKSDKRSSFDSQRESPYFKGKVKTEEYKTGEYAKKSWWGSKDYGKKPYEGNTDGSRFRTKARQEGQMSRDHGKAAQIPEPFETNTLDRPSARESLNPEIERPSSPVVESRKKVFKAPSVIDWKEQRAMSMDKSRGILGR